MLRAGDIFLMEGEKFLDRLINFFQALWNGDRRSSCTHAGVILNDSGDTLETTNWRTGFLNLFTDHPGDSVMVFRWQGMNPWLAYVSGDAVADQVGRIYPYQRLVLFTVGLAKYIHWRGMVCSELVARFLVACGARGSWWGINVDLLHDDCLNSKEWKLIYHGKPREMI